MSSSFLYCIRYKSFLITAIALFQRLPFIFNTNGKHSYMYFSWKEEYSLTDALKDCNNN